jgi:hypothetical protein
MIERAKKTIAMCTKQTMRLAVSRSTRPIVSVHHSIQPVEDGRFHSFIRRIAAVTLENVRYAIERTSSFIKVFFWSRESLAIQVPRDVTHPGPTINTDTWVWIKCLRRD